MHDRPQFTVQKMARPGGLNIPTQNGVINIGLITYELPTWEGTKNPERLDILGYNRQQHNHHLVAFEIKGPSAGRVDLENLFFQGLQHRDWVEQNKMAIKLIFDGPNGKRINTKKRVHLILGFFGDKIPALFSKLRHKQQRRDNYLKIDFVRLIRENNDLKIEP